MVLPEKQAHFWPRLFWTVFIVLLISESPIYLFILKLLVCPGGPFSQVSFGYPAGGWCLMNLKGEFTCVVLRLEVTWSHINFKWLFLCVFLCSPFSVVIELRGDEAMDLVKFSPKRGQFSTQYLILFHSACHPYTTVGGVGGGDFVF